MRLQLVVTSLFTSHRQETTCNCSPVAISCSPVQLPVQVKSCNWTLKHYISPEVSWIPGAIVELWSKHNMMSQRLWRVESTFSQTDVNVIVTPVTTNRIQDRRFRPRAWSHSPRACYRSPRSLTRHHYAPPMSYSISSRPHNPT